MTTHVALAVARMHGVLVHRPGSGVFHVASSDDLTPSGRYLRRAARTSCSARTRRLSVISRIGVTVDLGGRRMCARCSVRLTAVARRAEQPPFQRAERIVFFDGVTLTDLDVASVVASSVDETHAIGSVLLLRFGRPPMRRPTEAGDRQLLFDVHSDLLRHRARLAAEERTPEEIEAAARLREQQAADDALLLAGHRRDDRLARIQDKADQGKYLPTWDRQLVKNA